MPTPDCAGPDPRPTPPVEKIPTGAVDSHAHVFGPAARFAYAAVRAYTPPDSPLPNYLAMLDACGLDYGVLVQPSVYGNDNGCLLAALAAAKGRLRGVVVADPRTLDAQTIDAWSQLGVCGIRVNMAVGGGLPLSDIEAMAACLSEMGWHLDLIVDRAERLAEMMRRLLDLPVPLVIEQMGRVKGNQTPDTPGFQALLALVRAGNTWVKLSHAYHISVTGPPYADTTPFAHALTEAALNRIVWGSDWPHPMLDGPMPNDGALLDLLARWVPGAEDRRTVLVTNPTRLYGFTDFEENAG